MEENYTLHELQGDEITEPHMHDIPTETGPESFVEYEHEPFAPPTPGHSLEFVPIEEPGPNWEMELAQAYVRAQPLDGVFPPEEGLRMGTVFPNLSQPYSGRE